MTENVAFFCLSFELEPFPEQRLFKTKGLITSMATRAYVPD
jgi:hypothetical protein